MKHNILFLLVITSSLSINAQFIYSKEQLYSPYAINNLKTQTRKEKMIRQANELINLPISADADTSEPIETALWNIAQFMIRTPSSDSAIQRLVRNYSLLAESSQRALLEVLYGLYPKEYYSEMVNILRSSTHPKNFAMAAAYIYRAYPTDAGKQLIMLKAMEIKGNEAQMLMLKNLLHYINNYSATDPLPPLDSLFTHRQVHGFKVIYSFQRKDRNNPGLAVVQNADGSFARDSTGRLRTFVQLARSASNLPWFITNGSTPQGLYSITGIGFSKNVFIGPTPNLQLGMLYEINPPSFTHYFPPVFNAPPEKLYRSYFPNNWQQWSGLMEAFDAGKIGRTEIIAHGSTIDPSWYSSYAFYPITPTLGCLCGREMWNSQTGKIESSDQLDLVNAFIETPGNKGYLIVINIDDKQTAVTPSEIERLVDHYEAGIKKPGAQKDQAVH